MIRYQEEDGETSLLCRLAPSLNDRLGPLVIWAFTASFMSDCSWVARMDYTLEGDDKKTMKSVLLDGNGDTVHNMTYLRPRVFPERPSIAVLRAGLIMMELESPDPGERVA